MNKISIIGAGRVGESTAQFIALEGEYGLQDIALGVPAVLGKNSIEDIIQLDLNEEEKSMLKHSASLVREDINLLKSM